MKVRLTTGRWDQRTPKGIVRRRRGELVTVKDEVADWLIRSGAAEPAGRAPSSPASSAPADVIDDLDDAAPEIVTDEDDGEEPVDAEPEVGERPAQSAPKAAWVAYAISRGIPAKEAEAMDKPKLISRTG